MGLFSSKYVTTVGTVTSRLIEDKYIVSSAKTGLVQGLFSKESNQLIEHVLESMTNSIGMRAEKMYTYAKTYYTHGLPYSQIFRSTSGQTAVTQILKNTVNPSITIDYYHFGPLNNLHVGWKMLCENYGYNTTTNQLTTLSTAKGFPVYLEDLVVVVQEATAAEKANGSLDQWGSAAKGRFLPQRLITSGVSAPLNVPTPFEISPSAIGDAVRVSYVWEVPTTVIAEPAKTIVENGVSRVVPAITVIRKILHKEEMVLPLSGYDTSQDFFHVKYMNGSQEGYWLYQYKSGGNVALDRIFDALPSTAGEFFPFIYFREKAKNVSVDKTTPAYKTSQKMMKTLGLDYQASIDAIHENPDIASIDQALMMFAVPPNSQNPQELRYLFDFFDKLYLASGGVGVGNGWELGDLGTGVVQEGMDNSRPMTVNELLIQRKLQGTGAPAIQITIEDKLLKTGLSCQGIFKTIKAGVIGQEGKYTGSFVTENKTYNYSQRTSAGVDESGNPVYINTPGTLTQPVDSFIYRYQITGSAYEEIQVYDLQMTYYMYGGYSTLGDNLDAILLVPLDRAITKNYSLADREVLYSRSIHYIFNTRVVTKVRWYQQGWFADLIQIVGIILTIVSLGTDGGFFANLATAVAAGLEALAVFVLTTIVPMITSYIADLLVLKLFVKVLGPEFAFLVAIVAIAYSGYKAYEAGSIKGAPWASELLQLGNGLARQVGASMMDAMQGLAKEAEAFSFMAKEKMGLLEDANKLLDEQNFLSPLVIFGESPDDFYNRSLAGNIGILGIESITSFVDVALTLPKINETLEGYSYG